MINWHVEECPDGDSVRHLAASEPFAIIRCRVDGKWSPACLYWKGVCVDEFETVEEAKKRAEWILSSQRRRQETCAEEGG